MKDMFGSNKLVVLVGLIFISCQTSEKRATEKAITEIPNPVKKVVLEGLKRPWSAAFLSKNEVLISEKDGNLLQVNLSTKKRVKIKGFPNDLTDTLLIDASKHPIGTFPRDADGKKLKYNAGIFDVVLHPNFKNNNILYISYVSSKAENSTTKVIRSVLEKDSLTQIKTVFVANPYTIGLFHYGGGMTFGADGKLYITIGERLFTEANQPEMPIAQDLTDKRGKIYRLNDDGSIPEDNPDFGTKAVPGLFALGIRAAQGITLNPKTGQIWFSEHGTNQGDEINILQSGANYGWPIKTTGGYRGEGYTPPKLEDRTFTDPKWYWRHTVAPTGLTFYTGDDFPQWKDNLFIPGLSRGSLWRIVIQDETITSLEELFVNDRVRTRKVVQSPDGKIYLLTDEENGKMILIENKVN
ncbi:MAG: PQQ-dependent sugar dehydrogenase [Maribacter sp.]